jgi:SAM-dependent methyltransferase
VLPIGLLEQGLNRRVPALLSRARALLRLSGGPSDALTPQEEKKAAAAIGALHEGLVGDRVLARPETYDAAAHLGAYLLWWWPQSYAKVRGALALSPHALSQVGKAGRAQLLDLGAGTGPAAAAALDHLALAGLKAEALLCDRSEASLDEARGLITSPLRTEQRDLSRGAAGLPGEEGRFDLICAANVLSELPGSAADRAAMVRLAAGRLNPGGRLLLLEPALRETGRGLLEVRDLLLGPHAQPLSVYAPCFTQQPCPALEHPRDWCTAEQPWEPPAYFRSLSKALGLHAAEAPVQFAAVVLGAEPAPPGVERHRVVGLPPPEKGKKRLFICSAAGRAPLVRLDRDAAPANSALDTATRGDVLRLTGLTEKGDGLRLSKDGTAELVK